MPGHQPMMYLVSFTNQHPQVMKRYKYLILADSLRQVTERAQSDFDGQFTEYCQIESIELIPALCSFAWYLPEYIPESLSQ